MPVVVLHNFPTSLHDHHPDNYGTEKVAVLREAAASGGPRRGAKKAAEPAGEGAKKVDPHQLEIDKFDKLLEQAHKNQITEQ